MFRRAHEEYLSQWKRRVGRKPLIVRGARQVGKSALVRMFGQSQFASMVELNFERDPDLAELFASKDPRTILSLLELKAGARIVPGETPVPT